MPSAEKYLKPEVIRQIKRLDLRAQFIVKGFLHGLHASPVPRLLGRVQRTPQVHARRRPEGHRLAGLRQDRQVLRQEVRGRDEHHRLPGDGPEPLDGLHLSAGVDEVRLLDLPGGRAVLPDDPPARPGGAADLRPKIRHSLRPKARRSHLGDVLSLLANLKPEGETDIAHSLVQVAAMLRHASLVMVFSDLLAEPSRSSKRSTGCGTAATT